MHFVQRLLLILGVLSLTVAGSIATAHGVSAQSDVVGQVYVNNNTAGANTVGAFDRHADGTLTPAPGAPFAAGGAGTGTIIGAQGALQRSSDGKYLVVADAGSNEISVLRIRPDGSLRTVEGSPVPSGGTQPVSIAVSGDLVYVANSGGTTSNYTGFRLNPGGHLRPMPDSTYALPPGTVVGDVLFSGDGSHLAGTRVDTPTLPSLIDSFAVGSDGRLTPAPGSPFPAQSIGPFGSAFRPTDPTQLFVSNAHAGANRGTVSAFTVLPDGTLTSIGASPYPDTQTAPCWVEISHDGQYLFAVNTGTPSISRYAINPDGSLSLLGSTPFTSPTGLRPFDARLDPSGSFLYVVDAGANAVSGFAVSGGTLSELPSSPVVQPTPATPFGIVVT